MGDMFAQSSYQASCNYCIGSDGRIGLIVEEKDRSWCSSSRSNDHRAITIECASERSHPYAVNDEVYDSLIDLLVDICKRNDIKELKWKGDKSLVGQTDKQNMTVHRWFANKACPGDYLYNLHGQIAKEVNAKLNSSVNDAEQNKILLTSANDIAWELNHSFFPITEMEKFVKELDEAKEKNSSLYWGYYKLVNRIK